MDFNFEKINEEHILIKLEKNQLEFRKAMEFRDSIFEFLKEGIKNIDIDFEKINYIDSSGLGILVTILKKLMLRGGKLVLINVEKRVYNIFELSSLTKLMEIKMKLID